jgi:membrane protease YdiL (CAAX protease family)
LRKADLAAVLFAIVFPTVSAWAYAQAFANDAAATPTASPAVQTAYTLGKVLQFAFPLLWVWGIERKRVWPGKPTLEGLKSGVGFGLAVSLAGFVLYFGILRGTSLFRDVPEALRLKMATFGIDTPARYLAFTAFLAIVHSLLEEYYWRWFVFGKLRSFVGCWMAIALSSLAFMAYHVVLLHPIFPGKFWTLVMPISLCIAVGGCVWAWLYERTGSIYAPWISHLLIDLAIFAMGYDLIFGRL